MTTPQLTDRELDKLLSMPIVPVHDHDFTKAVLTRIERQEMIRLYIPFIFGAIGAVIASFFIPSDLFTGLFSFSFNKNAMIEFALEPMTLATILCCPMAILLFKEN